MFTMTKAYVFMLLRFQLFDMTINYRVVHAMYLHCLQSLQQMGNSRARAVYEAILPDGFRRPQTDCSLESFIRAKYEHKKYIAREWVPPPLPKV